MNTPYLEIKKSNVLDLYPELTESYYSVPLDPNSLVELLVHLHNSGKYELYDNILTFLKEEYTEGFSKIFPDIQINYE